MALGTFSLTFVVSNSLFHEWFVAQCENGLLAAGIPSNQPWDDRNCRHLDSDDIRLRCFLISEGYPRHQALRFSLANSGSQRLARSSR